MDQADSDLRTGISSALGGTPSPVRSASWSATPRGTQHTRCRSLGRIAQQLRSISDDELPNASEVDESLAQAASSLEISCAASIERSTGGTSSGFAHSGASSSWSPALSGRSRRHSKRRSISDLSQSARMTPKTLEKRGMGIPWQKAPALCTIDLKRDEVADQARDFCLVPTPELVKTGRSPPHTPDVGSPGAMQRRFIDRVRMASLCQSPEEDRRRVGGLSHTPGECSMGSSRLESTEEEQQDPVSPIQPTADGSPLEDHSGLFSPPPRRLARPMLNAPHTMRASPPVLDLKASLGAPQLHTARRAEERMQVSCRVQPQILKARRPVPTRTQTPCGVAARMARPLVAAIPHSCANSVKENNNPATGSLGTRALGKMASPRLRERDLRLSANNN